MGSMGLAMDGQGWVEMKQPMVGETDDLQVQSNATPTPDNRRRDRLMPSLQATLATLGLLFLLTGHYRALDDESVKAWMWTDVGTFLAHLPLLILLGGLAYWNGKMAVRAVPRRHRWGTICLVAWAILFVLTTAIQQPVMKRTTHELLIETDGACCLNGVAAESFTALASSSLILSAVLAVGESAWGKRTLRQWRERRERRIQEAAIAAEAPNDHPHVEGPSKSKTATAKAALYGQSTAAQILTLLAALFLILGMWWGTMQNQPQLQLGSSIWAIVLFVASLIVDWRYKKRKSSK